MGNVDAKYLPALINLTCVLFLFRQQKSSAALWILRQRPALLCCPSYYIRE
ncbi:hypothetical protein BN1184_BU_00420 [Pantoea ananatis]|nr:hypothetical protein BN1184_BU_00420 [Pantoea ananatis]